MVRGSILKIRISHSEKAQLVGFADSAGKSVSEIVRSAISEVMRGKVAGHQRRKDIAGLRRSTNLMIEAFAAKPIDVPRLKEIASQVRTDAIRVLT